MEKHQKLLRERNITKTYNNVFRRQHAWHPYTFKMRERHERHHGHEGEIDDKSVFIIPRDSGFNNKEKIEGAIKTIIFIL